MTIEAKSDQIYIVEYDLGQGSQFNQGLTYEEAITEATVYKAQGYPACVRMKGEKMPIVWGARG